MKINLIYVYSFNVVYVGCWSDINISVLYVYYVIRLNMLE